MKKCRAVELLYNVVFMKQFFKVYFLVSGAVNAILKACPEYQFLTFMPVRILHNMYKLNAVNIFFFNKKGNCS